MYGYSMLIKPFVVPSSHHTPLFNTNKIELSVQSKKSLRILADNVYTYYYVYAEQGRLLLLS